MSLLLKTSPPVNIRGPLPTSHFLATLHPPLCLNLPPMMYKPVYARAPSHTSRDAKLCSETQDCHESRLKDRLFHLRGEVQRWESPLNLTIITICHITEAPKCQIPISLGLIHLSMFTKEATSIQFFPDIFQLVV